MSGYAIFVHDGNLYVAHGLDAANQLSQRLTGAIASGEATGVIVRGVDGAMPILETYNDLGFWRDVGTSLVNTDYNALTRDTLAGMFGIIGGLLALPAGPTTSVMADMLLSEIYKKCYDAITAGSRDFVNRLMDFFDGDPIYSGINDIEYNIMGDVAGYTNNSLNWVPPRRDPLVLDLDGNGITTSGINPAAPIYFDQDADGIKTATGWIASGEAIVVRDLNGNGLIDSGRELFGDNTILTRGARAGQLAANGFEALADLDSNGDGKFNSADTAFASVKLWKDANQNGISETAELFTFAQLGVASINVTGTASNVNLGGGNTQTVTGSFTRTAGTVGEAGTAHLAGSLLLANNNFYRQFTDDPALTTAAQALPQMRGSGAVRDLRPALSLGTAQAASLQTALGQFASGSTKAQQLSQLDAVIQSWGATSSMQTSVQTNRTLTIPVSGAGSVTAIAQFAQSNPALYAQITALERFNGQTILDKWVRPAGATNAVSFSAEQQALLQQAYDALKNSVYGALVVQTRLKPYLDSIGLVVDQTGVRFDATALGEILQYEFSSCHRLFGKRYKSFLNTEIIQVGHQSLSANDANFVRAA